jgi:hypothetical protein
MLMVILPSNHLRWPSASRAHFDIGGDLVVVVAAGASSSSSGTTRRSSFLLEPATNARLSHTSDVALAYRRCYWKICEVVHRPSSPSPQPSPC